MKRSALSVQKRAHVLLEGKMRQRHFDYIYLAQRKPRGTTIHHVRPRSQGGSDEIRNLVAWPRELHNAWHMLFENMTLQQIHRFIELVSCGNGRGFSYKAWANLIEEMKSGNR